MTVWLRFLRWLGYPVKLPSERHVPWFHDATLSKLDRALTTGTSIEVATAMQRRLNENRSAMLEFAAYDGAFVRMPYRATDGSLYQRTYRVGFRTTLRGAVVREEVPWGDLEWSE